MSDSAWTLLMIVLAPVVFINLVLFGLLEGSSSDQ